MTKVDKESFVWGDISGAFADGAVLFPLVALLSQDVGFSATRLLLTAGLLYVVAGVLFRVPMAVQPLKALSLSAVALHATVSEVRLGGMILGFCCLALLLFDIGKFFSRIPRHIVHGIQLGLGLLFIAQGIQFALRASPSSLWVMLIIGLAACVMLSGHLLKFPLIGVVGTIGFLWAVVGNSQLSSPRLLSSAVLRGPEDLGIHPLLVLSLVLPQLVLTLANSVVGTEDVAKHYFGERAYRVNPKRLLSSIAFGNIVTAFVGGLPFCHGAGGVTAHVRGGARHWFSNLVIGCSLIALALTSDFAKRAAAGYPLMLVSVLLIAIGFSHIGLAQRSWKDASKRFPLICMGLAALLTQNMLWVLGIALIIEIISEMTARRMENIS